MNIIGVIGLARSGKDTTADWLVRERGFCKVALADPIKRYCMDAFGFTEYQLWGGGRDVPDLRWERPGGECLTPRHALQQLGTEWGRSMHPSVWVRKAISTAERILVCGDGYSQERGLNPLGWVDDEPVGVVIPDVRFLNEAAAIRAAGGRLVRVTRPGYKGLDGAAADHMSEREASSMLLLSDDRELTNAGSLEAFYAKLQEVFPERTGRSRQAG